MARGKLIATTFVVGGALLSWHFQIERQRITTVGMLIIWPGNGLVTAVLKLVMYNWLWKQLPGAADSNSKQVARLELIYLALGAAVLTGTNFSLLFNLLNKGVPPWHWTTHAALWLAGATVFICILTLRGKPLDAWVFGVLVGVNFIPTTLQGVAFLLYGMKGMPIESCIILLVLAYGMYVQALPKSRSWREKFIFPKRRLKLGQDAAILIPLVDLLVQVFTFGLCWSLVKLVPSWFPLL